MTKVILIDNGHGKETPGKCSPDKTLLEWKWTREVAALIVRGLTERGQDARLLTPEENDIKLSERVRRANTVCRSRGIGNVLLVSVHVNAAGNDGQWHDARGFSVWVARKASENSRKVAKLLYEEAAVRGLKGNRYVPRERYWQSDFYILKNTACPAVLTENLFQDNRADVTYLLTDAGKREIADLHIQAILKYVE